jgi:hypothetical protein
MLDLPLKSGANVRQVVSLPQINASNCSSRESQNRGVLKDETSDKCSQEAPDETGHNLTVPLPQSYSNQA